MASRRSPSALQTVAQLRTLQLRAARERAVPVRRELDRAETASSAANDELKKQFAQFSATLGAGVSVPSFLNAQATIAALARRRDAADGKLAEKRTEWETQRALLALAQAFADAADNAALLERRQLQAREEKRSLMELEERYSSSKRRST